MSIHDKGSKLQRIEKLDTVSLELGCGDHKRLDYAIGIDMLDYECVNIVGDIVEALNSFPDSSVEKIYSYHFIEHIAGLDAIMSIISRIVKQGGVVHFVAPRFLNPYFCSDSTHKSLFGLYTFWYFCTGGGFSRKVPTYKKSRILS
jgi:ubiquinone/menaquinone biosynthesis C-methylase UbiE